MICHNSVGYDAQIKDLLIKSAFNMDKKEIDAWIKYQYDPQHMFCFWQNDVFRSTNARICDWYGCNFTRL